MANWESLIGAKIESHRETHKVCKIDDAGKRNARRAQLKWKSEHREQVNDTVRKWRAKNPEKVKRYQENAKPAIKKWAEEHPERKRELNRKSDRKRANSEKRKAWREEYNKRPEVIERRRERDRIRNQTPERKAWERERSKRRASAKKQMKETVQ